jgi:hypothetical protein
MQNIKKYQINKVGRRSVNITHLRPNNKRPLAGSPAGLKQKEGRAMHGQDNFFNDNNRK